MPRARAGARTAGHGPRAGTTARRRSLRQRSDRRSGPRTRPRAARARLARAGRHRPWVTYWMQPPGRVLLLAGARVAGLPPVLSRWRPASVVLTMTVAFAWMWATM